MEAGTFGKIVMLSEMQELKSENIALKQEVSNLRDQVKQLVTSFSKF
jgi:cell division protein FtsB